MTSPSRVLPIFACAGESTKPALYFLNIPSKELRVRKAGVFKTGMSAFEMKGEHCPKDNLNCPNSWATNIIYKLSRSWGGGGGEGGRERELPFSPSPSRPPNTPHLRREFARRLMFLKKSTNFAWKKHPTPSGYMFCQCFSSSVWIQLRIAWLGWPG